MAEPMPAGVYSAVFDRAESDAGWPACEVMMPGSCVGQASQWHHRLMRSQGGGHHPANGLAVCHGCHSLIHSRPSDAYEAGWLVKSHDDPAVRMALRRGVWVTLDDAGQFTAYEGIGLEWQ